MRGLWRNMKPMSKKIKPIAQPTKRKGTNPNKLRGINDYDRSFDFIIETMCRRAGSSIADIAAALSTQEATVMEWLYRHEGFMSAYKRGQDFWNYEKVEKVLLKRVMGYAYEEVTEKSTVYTKGKFQMPVIERTVVKKQMAPDTGAIYFWLQNRAPTRWRNTKYLVADITGQVMQVERKELFIDLKGCSEEELKALRPVIERKQIAAERDLARRANESGPEPIEVTDA